MKTNLYYKMTSLLYRLFMVIFIRPKVIGRDNIPKNGRVIIAGNHTSNFDPLLMIAYSKRQFCFLAKKELFKGVLKPGMIAMGCIPVDRSVHDKNVLINANKVLEKDGVIAIYPEGTINRTEDTIMKFKIGAVKLAHDNNSMIVPFTITGKYRLFGIGGRVRLEYLEPISVEDDLDKANEKLMSIIKNRLEELDEKKN